MSELHVRNAGVGRDSAGIVELEYGPVRRGGGRADGRLGKEEGDEVPEGFWGEVSEEAVQHVAWDLVGMDGSGVAYLIGVEAGFVGRPRRDEHTMGIRPSSMGATRLV